MRMHIWTCMIIQTLCAVDYYFTLLLWSGFRFLATKHMIVVMMMIYDEKVCGWAANCAQSWTLIRDSMGKSPS